MQVNVGKQYYFFPRTMLLSDRMRLLNDIAKVCFSPVLSLSKKTQKRMLKKIVNKAYQLSAFDAGCRVAVKTYGNMSQKERATKDGKKLAAYLHEKDAAILEMTVISHDAGLLKEYLDFGLSNPENVKKAFDLVNSDAAAYKQEAEPAKSRQTAASPSYAYLSSNLWNRPKHSLNFKNDNDTVIKAYLMQAMQTEEQEEFEI